VSCRRPCLGGAVDGADKRYYPFSGGLMTQYNWVISNSGEPAGRSAGPRCDQEPRVLDHLRLQRAAQLHRRGQLQHLQRELRVRRLSSGAD